MCSVLCRGVDCPVITLSSTEPGPIRGEPELVRGRRAGESQESRSEPAEPELTPWLADLVQ